MSDLDLERLRGIAQAAQGGDMDTLRRFRSHCSPSVCLQLIQEIQRVRRAALEEAAPLIRLGLKALEECRDGCDFDGFDIQDKAEAFGVIARQHVTEPCGERCSCAEEDDFPTECYRDTDATAAMRKWLSLHESGEGK